MIGLVKYLSDGLFLSKWLVLEQNKQHNGLDFIPKVKSLFTGNWPSAQPDEKQTFNPWYSLCICKINRCLLFCWFGQTPAQSLWTSCSSFLWGSQDQNQINFSQQRNLLTRITCSVQRSENVSLTFPTVLSRYRIRANSPPDTQLLSICHRPNPLSTGAHLDPQRLENPGRITSLERGVWGLDAQVCVNVYVSD